jgi:pectate lyase
MGSQIWELVSTIWPLLDALLTIDSENDFGNAGVNITQVGNFTSVEYGYKLTKLKEVERYVRRNAGIGKISIP